MTVRRIKSVKGNLRTLLGATEFKSVKSLMTQLGISSVKNAHEFLLDNYIEIVDTIIDNETAQKQKQKLSVKQNNTDAKQFLKSISNLISESKIRKNKKPVMPILDFKVDYNGNKSYKFEKYISFWNNKNNKDNHKFNITLKSLVTGMNHTFKFNDVLHFHNWFEKVKQNTISSDDYGSKINSINHFKPINLKNKNFKIIIINHLKKVCLMD